MIGQEEAIEHVVSLYQKLSTGMTAPVCPIGNFLFLGPTGAGVTRMLEAVIECLESNPRAVIKIDCREFHHSHEFAMRMGSPPGYLGHRETYAMLSQEIPNHHDTDTAKVSFALFDEIEKASDTLWNLLLGALDKETVTLGDNRKIDFSRAIIFMIGDLGESEMSALASLKLGFNTREALRHNVSDATNQKFEEKITLSGVEAARREFTLEFINRLDKIVTFKPLDVDQLRRLVELLRPKLYRFFASSIGSKTDAEDMLQDLWLRIHSVRHTYRPDEPVLPWIYAIARRVRIDDYRKRHRLRSRETSVDVLPEPSVCKDGRSNLPKFEELVAALPESQREVLTMLKVNGLTIEEVARATSSTVGAVKQKIHRAYKRLHRILKKTPNSTNKGAAQ